MPALKCTGMQNILNGYLRYRSKLRGQLLKEFQLAGETFIARNPGTFMFKIHKRTKFDFFLNR